MYGGLLTLVGADIQIFGAAVSNRGSGQAGYVIQQILGLDRTTGPAGSGKVDYSGGATAFDDVVGFLAESWSTPSLGVWVLNIRKGVHFGLNPGNAASMLVNGRELTAEDVAFSLEYIRDTHTSWIQLSEPALIKGMTIERSGPSQLTIKTPVNPANAYLWLMGGGGNGYVWPKEFLQKYGTSNDWHDNTSGTGPYILADFVPGSQATYKRNNNYWEKDPVGPGKGNQLPYIDRINYLVIPDLSTVQAAFRTGKIDRITGITLEDGKAMLKTNPSTKYYQTIIAPNQVAMRTDKKDLPYKDIRVRQAMMMATDMQGMKDSLYQGKAEILDSPARKLYTGVFTPLEQLPATTAEMYKYNPEKAKQLLKDAGYPNGFKANMVLPTSSTAGDLAAVLKDMWAKVGIDITLQPKDSATYNAIFANRGYDELFFGTQPGGTGQLYTRYGNSYFRTQNNFNLSYVDDPSVGTTDPTIEKYFNDVSANVMINYPKCEQLMKELNLYTLSQAYLIPTPAPYTYIMWQPWLKSYYGEGAAQGWLQFIWIDQPTKTKMGY